LVVADSIYGENADLEAQLFAAKIPYIMGAQARAWRLAAGQRSCQATCFHSR
jgi:hypothetical protein